MTCHLISFLFLTTKHSNDDLSAFQQAPKHYGSLTSVKSLHVYWNSIQA